MEGGAGAFALLSHLRVSGDSTVRVRGERGGVGGVKKEGKKGQRRVEFPLRKDSENKETSPRKKEKQANVMAFFCTEPLLKLQPS